MEEIAVEINTIISETRSNLHMYTDEQMRLKTNPKKWSKIEILGHLVDSAVNNLKRFTEIPFMKDNYQFSSYSQDNLVMSNHYQESDLNLTIDLWSLLNRHIAFVIKHISAESKKQKITLLSGEVVTLTFLIEDYVDHLKHHLDQIFA